MRTVIKLVRVRRQFAGDRFEWFLPTRRYASAVLTMALAVRLFTCLSVTSRSSVKLDRRILLIFGMETSFDLSYTVLY